MKKVIVSICLILSAWVGACYYNPVPLSVKGNFECTYEGHRAFVGELEINGEGITDGIHTFDPNGTWRLCKTTEPIECRIATKTATGAQ